MGLGVLSEDVAAGECWDRALLVAGADDDDDADGLAFGKYRLGPLSVVVVVVSVICGALTWTSPSILWG